MTEREQKVEQALKLVAERSAEIAPGTRMEYNPSEVEKVLAEEVIRLRQAGG